MPDHHLILTVHGINSDGEWQDQAHKILVRHGTDCVPYQYRQYRYWGFVLQLFDPVPAMLALSFIGALLSLQPETQSFADWIPTALMGMSPRSFLVAFAAVQIAVAILVIHLSLTTAMKPARERPSKGKFATVLFLCLLVIASRALFPESGPYRWVILSAAGVLCLLVGLLEAFAVSPVVNTSKTWLIPAGVALLALSTGSTLGRASVYLLGILGFEHALWWATVAFWVLASLAVLLTVHGARNRRVQCVKKLVEWIERETEAYKKKCGESFAVHLIAHSFGTYLVGEMLKAWNGQSFQEVVLVGSALRADYQWEGILSRGAVVQVRNEVGGRDAVIRYAGLSLDFAPLTWLPGNSTIKHWRPFESLGLGSAGHTGFSQADHRWVHNVRNSLEYCEQCRTREERKSPRVHNVWLPTFRHSDGVDAAERVGRFWLPLMLGFEPWEYWDFRRLCSQKEAYAETRQARIQDANAIGKTLEELAIRMTKAAGHSTPTVAIEGEIKELEKQQNDFLNRAEEARKQGLAVLSQLELRAWDWTWVDGQRGTLHYFIADKLEDVWFSALHPKPNVDDAKVYAWVAAKRAHAAVSDLAERCIKAIGALRDLEQSPGADHPPAEGERGSLKNLDPRVVVQAMVGEVPLPTPAELLEAKAEIPAQYGAGIDAQAKKDVH